MLSRLAVAAFVALSVAAPAASAAPPPQGCAQADEAGVGGAYHSTCDGSPSQNGNGNGAATGKPCAGCVGAADNKNPPGQAPDGTDPNNGYECDGNSGIGKTNPAHTGCVSEPYSGADVDVAGKGRGNDARSSKSSRLAGFRGERSGATGGTLVVTALALIAAVALASAGIRRIVRR